MKGKIDDILDIIHYDYGLKGQHIHFCELQIWQIWQIIILDMKNVCSLGSFHFYKDTQIQKKATIAWKFCVLAYILCIHIFFNEYFFPIWTEGFNLNFNPSRKFPGNILFCLALCKHWAYLLSRNKTTEFYSQLQSELTPRKLNIAYFVCDFFWITYPPVYMSHYSKFEWKTVYMQQSWKKYFKLYVKTI